MDSPELLDGPMDSAWPMYCHDTRHTGRSPYSTVDVWDEKWRIGLSGLAHGEPVIDENGIIYMGAWNLYAIYPNGTLKWKHDTAMAIESAPAIGENGILYVGTIWAMPNYLYAIYTSNGTIKWKYQTDNHIWSSPAIGDDGTIFFGSEDKRIYALNSNGTLRWEYITGNAVLSSPAIGIDGTIYCGSHDTYLYALYPNNGTLKWRYKTGNWIRVSPCIADDGTIYVVSLDNYLHAIYPDGSFKWKTDVGAGTSPTIGQDGTIYAGYEELHAINPINGSVKWTFNVEGTLRGGTPCNSIDGAIYLGTSDGGNIIAIYSDGTEKWRKEIGECESGPAIGSDGTVYIGGGGDNGRLYAFGIGPLEVNANGPYYGLTNEPIQFEGYSRGGYSPHSYHWDFGDTYTSEEQNPLHTYSSPGNYSVVLTVTDDTGNITDDITWAWIQDGNTPPNIPVIDGPINGNSGTSYPYTFLTSDPEGLQILYFIDWDDGSNTGWIGPYSSGETITRSHKWDSQGTYNISAKAKDPYDAEGPWGELEVNMPRNKATTSSLFLRFLEQFPSAFPILRHLLGL